jgi:hypothetical protein
MYSYSIHRSCDGPCISNGDRAIGLQGLQTSLSGLPLKASCKWSITDIAVRRMTSNEAAPICGLREISSARCLRATGVLTSRGPYRG